MRVPVVIVVAAVLALGPTPVRAAGATWEHWKIVPGVFDVGGPRNYGALVVAGSAALYLVDAAGTVTPFDRGPGGYRDDPGAEAYLTVSPGGHVNAAGCDFARDETFLLRLHVPMGITRVDAPGENTGSFANVTGVTSLNGIAFDTTGAFDNRLLVSGSSKGKTVISAIDCNGAVTVITRSAPVLEGGLVVAPSGFGAFGGALLAPDEYSGKIYAIAADGTASVVARPALPTGSDTGVESLGFVPPGFIGRGGEVYYADRATPRNPHPGTDSVLRLSSSALSAAGVQDGDLLVATEGGAAMVAVHCQASCTVLPVISTASTSHGEGHIAFTINQPSPGTSPSPTSTLHSPIAEPSEAANQPNFTIWIVVPLLAVAAAIIAWTIRRRRSR